MKLKKNFDLAEVSNIDQGVVDNVYADAIRDRKKFRKLADETTKPAPEEKLNPKPSNPKMVPGVKKLHLDESLFKVLKEDFDTTPALKLNDIYLKWVGDRDGMDLYPYVKEGVSVDEDVLDMAYEAAVGEWISFTDYGLLFPNKEIDDITINSDDQNIIKYIAENDLFGLFGYHSKEEFEEEASKNNLVDLLTSREVDPKDISIIYKRITKDLRSLLNYYNELAEEEF